MKKNTQFDNVVTSMTSKVEMIESRFNAVVLNNIAELTSKEFLAKGRDVILIDTLRNSSCLTVALAAGANEIALYGKSVNSLDLLDTDYSNYQFAKCKAGEIEGQPIPGYNLTNSPLSFTTEKVIGKRIFYSSTNNGRAYNEILKIEGTGSIFWACMLNSITVGKAIAEGKIKLPVLIVCAGFRGTMALEDLICAGTILNVAENLNADVFPIDDGAWAAKNVSLNFFNKNGILEKEEELIKTMEECRCGKVIEFMKHIIDVQVTVNGKGIEEKTLNSARNTIPTLDKSSVTPIIKKFLNN